MKRTRIANGNRKTPTKTHAAKRYQEMTTAELRHATKEFDQEFVGETFGPPTREQRARFERARKRGRPALDMGTRTISVTVEKRLLVETGRLAKKLRLSRAALITRGLQAVVSEEVPIS